MSRMMEEIPDQPRALRRTFKAEQEYTKSSSDEGANINLSAATSKEKTPRRSSLPWGLLLEVAPRLYGSKPQALAANLPTR
jgi:hypothetical protein